MTITRVIAGVAVVAAVMGFFVWSEWRATPEPNAQRVVTEAPTLEEPSPRARDHSPPARLVRVAVTSEGPAVLDEPALMAKLRALGPGDPKLAIHLAREGNYRFPTSPDAAERAWFVAKSLAGLGRFEEARDEALVMVQRFRGTPWAADAERHLLVYPLGEPSREERQKWEKEEAEALP